MRAAIACIAKMDEFQNHNFNEVEDTIAKDFMYPKSS